MMRHEQVISVFVSSPTDVQAERTKLEEIVQETNMIWSGTIGLRLELVRWETHAHPGIGDDPQQVINQQVGDDYDIFIGIMWCRYGTPTGRAGSGTVEEFQRAKARYDQSQQPRIMFYFKDALVRPNDVDVDQLSDVRRFRNSLFSIGFFLICRSLRN